MNQVQISSEITLILSSHVALKNSPYLFTIQTANSNNLGSVWSHCWSSSMDSLKKLWSFCCLQRANRPWHLSTNFPLIVFSRLVASRWKPIIADGGRSGVLRCTWPLTSSWATRQGAVYLPRLSVQCLSEQKIFSYTYSLWSRKVCLMALWAFSWQKLRPA